MKTHLFLALMVILPLKSFSQVKSSKNKKYSEFIKKFSDFRFVPAGTFYVDPSRDSLVSLNSFFISSIEISNSNYRKFLNEMAKVVESDSLEALHPDTTVWYKDPIYVNNINIYRWHPAYGNFPIVGITYSQAKAYCNWLEKTINLNDNSIFKKVVVRLPLTYEWQYAATGGTERAIYPWKGRKLLKNKEGDYLVNFKKLNQAYIIESDSDTTYISYEEKCMEYSCDFTDFVSKCVSQQPNDFGLYNMAGNVSEYVYEKGILKGGSFNSTGYYLNLYHHEKYNDPEYRSAETGFRIVIQIVEY